MVFRRIIIPPNNKQEKAVQILLPIYEKLWNNDKNIKTLENMRDRLLPKLMSSEAKVKYE